MSTAAASFSSSTTRSESRRIARRHLDRLGWEVAEAEDGAGALQWLAQNPRPAMILLDLLMPGMNGFAFLEEIAKRCEWQDIPIVILTAMPLGAAERELLAGRTREVIAKGADDLAAGAAAGYCCACRRRTEVGRRRLMWGTRWPRS